MTPETPPNAEVEKHAYNPPTTVRQNHAPAWLNQIAGMFRRTIRPENQRFFEISHGSANGGGGKPGHQAKAIRKGSRHRDIAHESRRRNRRFT